MSDDLKTRLRWAADNSDGCGEWNCDPADLDAAADRIEELEERLRAAQDDAKEAEAYAKKLEANLAKVVEGLEKACTTLAKLTGEKA